MKSAQRLDELLKVKRANKVQVEEAKNIVCQLMKADGGWEVLTDKINSCPARKAMLLGSIMDHVAQATQGGVDDMPATLELLLFTIARQGKTNDKAKWQAMHLLLQKKVPGAIQVFVSVLKKIEPKKSIPDQYVRHVQPFMGEDGGLGWLVEITQLREHRSLGPFIGPVILKLRYRGTNDLPIPEKVLPTATEKTPVAVTTAAREAIHCPGLSETLEIIEEKIRQLHELVIKNQEEETRLRFRVKELEADNENLNNEQKNLQSENKKLSGALNDLQKEKFHAEGQLRKELGKVHEEHTHIKKDNARIAEKAKQDVAIVQSQAKHAVQAFKHELWDNIHPYMLEAIDPSIMIDEKPLAEQVLLRRLQSILKALRKADISPQD